jgi:hypothetical protein
MVWVVLAPQLVHTSVHFICIQLARSSCDSYYSSLIIFPFLRL